MKRKSPIFWFYLVGLIVIFLIVNNTDLLNDSKKVTTLLSDNTTVQQLEQDNTTLTLREIPHEIKKYESADLFSISLKIVVLIAVIALIIVLFEARKERNEEDVKNDLKDDISYLGRYCVDFKITIEDLQELAKKKSN